VREKHVGVGRTKCSDPHVARLVRVPPACACLCPQGLKMESLTYLQAAEEEPSVLPPYAPSVALFTQKDDPARVLSGFARTPSLLAGRSVESMTSAMFKVT
jgi:hypothetical protein